MKPVNTAMRRINPSTLSKPSGYTHVVVATGGHTIYLSGQVALDKDGKLVGPGDFRAQAKQVFENLRYALGATGATFDDIVKLNIYVLDMTNAPTFREVRDDYLPSNPPAATLIEVKKLARDEFMLEIEATAVTAK
jgi:enamine deaminase RidA (YjgF/YER057c/UK114 family)